MTALRKAATPLEIDRIVAHINALTKDDLERFGAWSGLRQLSARTRFDEIDGNPDSVVLDDAGAFEAQATIYVMLAYGPADAEDTMSDEYAATVRGRIEGDGVMIDHMDVDASPFDA